MKFQQQQQNRRISDTKRHSSDFPILCAIWYMIGSVFFFLLLLYFIVSISHSCSPLASQNLRITMCLCYNIENVICIYNASHAASIHVCLLKAFAHTIGLGWATSACNFEYMIHSISSHRAKNWEFENDLWTPAGYMGAHNFSCDAHFRLPHQNQKWNEMFFFIFH